MQVLPGRTLVHMRVVDAVACRVKPTEDIDRENLALGVRQQSRDGGDRLRADASVHDAAGAPAACFRKDVRSLEIQRRELSGSGEVVAAHRGPGKIGEERVVEIVDKLVDQQVVGIVSADIDGDIPGISSDVEGRVNVILRLAR